RRPGPDDEAQLRALDAALRAGRHRGEEGGAAGHDSGPVSRPGQTSCGPNVNRRTAEPVPEGHGRKGGERSWHPDRRGRLTLGGTVPALVLTAGVARAQTLPPGAVEQLDHLVGSQVETFAVLDTQSRVAGCHMVAIRELATAFVVRGFWVSA